MNNAFKIILVSRNNSQDPKTTEAVAFDALCKEKGVRVGDYHEESGAIDGVPQIVVYLAGTSTDTLRSASITASMCKIPIIAPVTRKEAYYLNPGVLIFITNSSEPEHIFSLAEKVMMFREHFGSGIYEQSDLTLLANRPVPLEERM